MDRAEKWPWSKRTFWVLRWGYWEDEEWACLDCLALAKERLLAAVLDYPRKSSLMVAVFLISEHYHCDTYVYYLDLPGDKITDRPTCVRKHSKHVQGWPQPKPNNFCQSLPPYPPQSPIKLSQARPLLPYFEKKRIPWPTIMAFPRFQSEPPRCQCP